MNPSTNPMQTQEPVLPEGTTDQKDASVFTRAKPAIQSRAELYQAIWQSSELQCDPHAFARGLGGLQSPLWIPGMEKAIELFKRTSKAKGQVRIIGDRDVDGVSSAAMLGNFLRSLYPHSPELYKIVVSDDGDDYGLSGEVLQKTIESSPDLLVLLDMGSSHGPEIQSLTEKGIQVIILDHHQIHDRLPDATKTAFVNPMRLAEDKRHEFLHEGRVATAGLVFKFLLGYALSHTREWKRIYILKDPKGKSYAYRLGGLLDGPALEKAKASSGYEILHLSIDSPLPWPETMPPKTEEQPRQSKTGNPSQSSPSSALPLLPKEEKDFLFANPNKAGPILLAKALESRPKLREFVYKISELAAIGLIADLVPLLGENRAMVRIGLGHTRDFRGWKNPGLSALIEKLRLPPGPLVSRDVSWSISPSINAAGRMGKTHKALAVLRATDPKEAQRLALELIALNQERKERTNNNEEIVRTHFGEKPEKLDPPFLFCYHPDLQKGVSGIVASRLTEKYQKPTIYIHKENEVHAKGSARTWDGVHVLDFIGNCHDLFLQFGGHPEAAGFSIRVEDIEVLEKRLLKAAKEGLPRIARKNGENSQEKNLRFRLAPHLIGPELMKYLYQFEPFGSGNAEPELVLQNVQVENPKYMSHGIHAKFKLKGVSRQVDFLLWQRGEKLRTLFEKKASLDLSGYLERSYFAGRTRLQFRISELSESKNT